MNKISTSRRRRERGQTILLVAVSIVSLLAMAALAIDITTFYVAKSEAQRAADAAALAGAKSIADSGVTTLQQSDPQFAAAQTLAQTMASAAVSAILPVNTVAGRPLLPASGTVSFNFAAQGDPQITVSVQQTGLPTFFARIWGQTGTTVQAAATAEAYNPSNNSSFTAVGPAIVKPWLIANLDPNNAGKLLVDTSNNAENPNIIGSSFNLTADCAVGSSNCNSPTDNPPKVRASGQLDYLPALVTPNAGNNVCSSLCTGAPYQESVACADVATVYSCTNGANWDPTTNPGGVAGPSSTGAQCLITHGTGGVGLNQGQDLLSYPTAYPAGPPVITSQSGAYSGYAVSTSSSIVTIPIFDQTKFAVTSPQVNIVGFLQAFINQVEGTASLNSNPGDINITVLNVVGCYGGGNTPPVVGGSGTSPVPVRLIGP